jgi:hypothetical protein
VLRTGGSSSSAGSPESAIGAVDLASCRSSPGQKPGRSTNREAMDTGD